MNHIEVSKSSTVVNSVLKKTRATMQGDLSEQKYLRTFESVQKSVSNYERVSSKKRRIQFSQTKTTFNNQPIQSTSTYCKLSSNPQRKQFQYDRKQKQATVEEILTKSLKVVNSVYSKQRKIQNLSIKNQNLRKISQFNSELKQKIIIVLRNLKVKSKQLASHLNTVFFSRPNIRVLGINEIQKQILNQWRKNILLSTIRTQWFVCLQEYFHQFQEQGYQIFQKVIYQQFCQFLAYITYIIFQPYYTLYTQNKKYDKHEIVNRLNKRTVRYVITQSTQWQNIVNLSILQTIAPKITYPQLNQANLPPLYQMVLAEMKIPQIREYLISRYNNKLPLFQSVRPALIRFINEHYIPHKIKCIILIRSALEKDIITYQKQLIERQQLDNLEMFQKDPMLTCLILAVLSSRISLKQIGMALKELTLMLGQDIQNILRIFQCPSYFTDLEAVVQFLANQAKQCQ